MLMITEEEYQVHLNRINGVFYTTFVLGIFSLLLKITFFIFDKNDLIPFQFADFFATLMSIFLIKKKMRTGFIIFIILQLITIFYLMNVSTFIVKSIILFFVIKGLISANKVYDYEIETGIIEKKSFKYNFIFVSGIILFLLIGTIFISILEEYPKDQVQKGIELKNEQKKNLIDLKILEKEELINYYYELISDEEHYLHFYTNDVFYYYNFLLPDGEDKFITLKLNKIETIDFKKSDSFLSNNSILHLKGIDGTEFNLHLSNHFGKDKDYYENLRGIVDKAKSK